MFNFSTCLTILRILLSPCLVWVTIQQEWLIGICIFIIAAMTDFLDGYYARLYQQETKFGALLDPVADKILGGCGLLGLFYAARYPLIPSWFLLLFCIKDGILMVGGLYSIWCGYQIIIRPSWFSKLTTTLFMIFLLYGMMIQAGYSSGYYISVTLVYFTFAMIYILIDYAYSFYIQMKG